MIIVLRRLASVLRVLDTAQAVTVHRRAVALLEEMLARSPADSETRRLLVLAAADLADTASRAGDSATAEEALARAVPEARRLVEEDPDPAVPRRELTRVLLSLGLTRMTVGRSASAAAELEEALQLAEALARANPRVGEYQRLRLSILGRLGEMEVECGRLARAGTRLDEVIRADEERAGREPPGVNSDLTLSWWYAVRGRIELDQGHGGAAVSWLERALGRIAAAEAREADREAFRVQRLDIEALLALARREAGERTALETADALRETAAAWAGLQATEPQDPSLRDARARADLVLAEAELAAGRTEAARDAADRSITALDAAVRGPTSDLITLSIHMKALASRAEALERARDRASALVAARASLDEARRMAAADDSYQYPLAGACARVARLIERGAEADDLRREALTALGRAAAAGFDNAHLLRPDGPLAGLPAEALTRLVARLTPERSEK